MRHIQCQNTRCDRRRKRRTVHAAVAAAHEGGIHRTGGNKIHVFAVVGIGCQLPAVLCERADTEHVFIGCGISQICGCIVACSGYTDHVAVKCQLSRLFERQWITCSKGHIDHGHVALNGVVQAEHQIGRALEYAVFVTLGLNNNDIHLRRDTHHTVAIHRRRNNTRHSGTVTLLVLD